MYRDEDEMLGRALLLGGLYQVGDALALYGLGAGSVPANPWMAEMTVRAPATEGTIGVYGKLAVIVGVEASRHRSEVVPADSPPKALQDGVRARFALYARHHILLSRSECTVDPDPHHVQ